MYEFLKKLLPISEQLGEIQSIQMNENDDVWGDLVKVSGVTNDNRNFEFKLTIWKDGAGNV